MMLYLLSRPSDCDPWERALWLSRGSQPVGCTTASQHHSNRCCFWNIKNPEELRHVPCPQRVCHQPRKIRHKTHKSKTLPEGLRTAPGTSRERQHMAVHGYQRKRKEWLWTHLIVGTHKYHYSLSYSKKLKCYCKSRGLLGAEQVIGRALLHGLKNHHQARTHF